MANALEAASLVMIPSGYEDGTLGSLKPTDGSGDFTFSRGSNLSATRINEQGYIEKGYENLLLQSNSFLTTWAKVSILPPTSGQAGYDGTNDAWLLEKIGSAGRIEQSISLSGIQTLSVYVKLVDPLLANAITLRADTTTGVFQANFNLSTETINGNSPISTHLEKIGDDGWYRCSIAYTGLTTIIRLYITLNGNVGTTSGSLYIQDAMLNQGLVAYPYIETTTASVAGGILEDMPRLDWSGSCPSLLLEPSRTNLFEYSEYFGAGWASNDTTITSNTSTSPEGLQNATTLADTSTSSFQQIEYRPSFTAGASYTLSMFIKKDSDTTRFPEVYFRIYNGGTAQELSVQINTQTGEKVDRYKLGTSPKSSVVDFSDDYWRLVINATDPNDGNNQLRIYLRPAMSTTIGSTSASATGSIVAYGLQLEQDATYPTSYIPTYGVSQTRLADILFEGASLLNNFFNPTEGTLFFEVDEPLFRQLTSDGRSIALRDTTNGEYFQLRGRSNSVYFLLTMCSPNVVSIANIENNTKYAIKWNGSEIKIFTDGAARGSSTQIDSFRPYTLGVASGFGMYTPTGEKFNNITFFPTALSDSECIALTTI